MPISPELTPPGGWQYPQGPTIIKGDTYDDLVKNVKAHRISNNLPLAVPERDIEDYLVKAFPQLKVGEKLVYKIHGR